MAEGRSIIINLNSAYQAKVIVAAGIGSGGFSSPARPRWKRTVQIPPVLMLEMLAPSKNHCVCVCVCVCVCARVCVCVCVCEESCIYIYICGSPV